MIDEPWTGEVVQQALGLELGPDEEAEPVRAVVGLALRRNPRRAHLPVSPLLGKHVPADPGRVRAAAVALARRVAHCLATGSGVRGDPIVLGYAENATALAHLLAEDLDAEHVVHTTRRIVPGAQVLAAVDEEHSHAPRHVLLPDDPGRWTPDRPLVLVDDELSTGRTAAATVHALHAVLPRGRYVVATLADLRGPDVALAEAARELGVRVDVVALSRAALVPPADVLDRAARLLARIPDTADRPAVRSATPVTVHLGLDGASEGARHGLDRPGRAALDAAVPGAAAAVEDALGPAPGRVLVLGTEELHHLPVRLAEALAGRGLDVAVGATSRSPLVARDLPGYPVRSALAFAAHDTAFGHAPERYAYGLGAPGAGHFDTVVLVVDGVARTPALRRPDGLLAALGAVCGRVIEAVVPCRAPCGRPRAVAARRAPEFGTFAPDEVGWLLSDLSGLALETSRARREEALGSGRAHYAETLPHETAPSRAYAEVVDRVLAEGADAVAAAVGVLADRILARHGAGAVLLSLARAGTPVAVLVRRWASRVRGVALPHYAMSVLRGRGLDRAALDALTAAHDPASLVLVDGWTGTGGIVDEVAGDLARHARATGHRVDPTVAVLADPAHATALYGTRADLLVPQACLNATVCGLVSRTVARADLLAPGAWHGAKYHAELAEQDRTGAFLDAVSARFPASAPTAGPGREPDRRGACYLAALARELGPLGGGRLRAGAGETLRALLRRDPAVVLLARDAGAHLDPVRVLCRERDVPVRELPDPCAGLASPYRCVGVLRPWRP
ncbi:phosphoribosyltransferase domain-containing protein [Actinomycetospora cinnamomea]|uniref:Pyrimidine operon attenuation protein/uracil phosphoribosyltransferase n=1 Tax=Actinomycetospora cinnamomea TaxID=663609 RepID=A0A2U1FPY4_9PSEU|nr:phosphoribosyltransferase domain-containing protein [Actinomycetospora cinnamomea]PVZ14219.1 pyrimidine operon attenuation protein/uracil phosphoribosyltransferase [Actinomycetospora cinnamomea]